MTPTLLLRISSGIFAGVRPRPYGGRIKEWSPMGPNPVLRAMTDVRFETMGANRSYLDFFLGFGWTIAIGMVLQSVLLWQLAALARQDGGEIARPMIAAFAIANLATAFVAWRFLFPVPAFFSAALFVPRRSLPDRALSHSPRRRSGRSGPE